MRDVIVMWRSTKMAVLAALCAGVYAALLIPFKAIPLIPGFTEIRPANVVPVVAGLLFGPAAAWGCAFGNLIGDFFGTIGPGSFFGFIGNFLFAYVPYRLWRTFMGNRPATGAPAQAAMFSLCAIIGAMSCAVIIGWGVDLLGMVPYQVLTAIITLNNSVAGVLLGLLLLPLVYHRANRWGLLYGDILPPEEHAPGRASPLGAALVIIGSVGGSLVALNMYLGDEAGPLVGIIPAGMSFKALATVCAGMILVGSALFTGLGARRREAAPDAEAVEARHDAPAIEVEDLTFTYPGAAAPALDGVAFRQERGELRVIMGRMGAGKSTLCKCLGGVIPGLETGPFAGTVRLLGRDIAGVPVHELAPVIGELFQDFESQLLTGSVEAEVAFPLENIGVEEVAMRARVRAALEAVGMWDLRERDPVLLSGGQKQRVALAAALATEPHIVVLDEPTTDLDPRGKRELADQCEKLRAAAKTLVIAGHETESALAADTLTVLRAGKVAYDGPPAELLADPARTEALGLRPLDMPALFAALGRDERPLGVDEAAAILRDAPCDEDVWAELMRTRGPEFDPRLREFGLRPAVRISGLRHVYPGDVEALAGVTLEVQEGEFVALLGENGSGKTTLAMHLNGLLQPTEGNVEVCGVDTRASGPARLAHIVGYLFQDPDHQIFAETVWEEAAFGPRNLDLPEEAVAERVRRALGAVGLEHEADADPFTLPKGRRQQVALASVLAMQPRVIVFDEPTTGLDGPQQQEMMERLRRLNDDGCTVIVITHCAWAAAQYARRVVVMDGGKIIGDGSTRQVFGDADVMARASQGVPDVTELGRRLWGRTVLSVDEMARLLGALRSD